MDATVTIREAADATGLTEDTLRYYERIGIVGEVERTASGHRRYSDQTLAWLGLVVRLRATGMPLETIQRYSELYRQGPATIAERREILATHQREIAREVERLSELSTMLDMKIARYDAVVATGIVAQAPCEAAPLLGSRGISRLPPATR
jgi:DNA-binding transcriptional MerR regulator